MFVATNERVRSLKVEIEIEGDFEHCVLPADVPEQTSSVPYTYRLGVRRSLNAQRGLFLGNVHRFHEIC